MKKNFYLALAAGLIVLSASCANPTGTPTSDYSKIWVLAMVKPVEEEISSGPTQYQAQVLIFDNSKTDLGDASSAVVKVNNTQLNLGVGSKTNFFASNVGSFSTGDTVTLDIHYAAIGSPSKTLVIPGSPSSFLLSPSLPEVGVANNISNYTASWVSSPGVNAFETIVRTYATQNGSVSKMSTADLPGNFTSLNFSTEDFQLSNGTVAPFVDVMFSYCSSADFAGFQSGSGYYVSSVDRLKYSNRN